MRLIRRYYSRLSFFPHSSSRSRLYLIKSKKFSNKSLQSSLNDTKKIFSPLSTPELLNSAILFQICQMPSIATPMIKLLNYSFEHSNNPLYKPFLYIAKKQYFPLFTGGESLHEAVPFIKKFNDVGVKIILDHSIEENKDPDVWNHNVQHKINLIDNIKKLLPPNIVPFIPLKLTSLTSPLLLEKITAVLNKESPSDNNLLSHLSKEDNELYNGTINRLHKIFDYAIDNNLKIWLDAEQYNRQPGLNFISRMLMLDYNNNGKIQFYNTYQLYLKDATKWVDYDLNFAKENRCGIGVKCVRGAYLEYEKRLSIQNNSPFPIHDSKKNTDIAYDNTVKKILNKISEDSNLYGVAVCTHNRPSIENAIKEMDKLGIDPKLPNIHFGQLKGMCDNLTIGLALNGYNCIKLVPFGKYNDVFPYLIRRLLENQDMLAGTAQEKSLLWKELRRRLNPIQSK